VEAVLATIALVLIAGAFVGNLFASRRRAEPRLSVYGLIQDRLHEARAGSLEGTARRRPADQPDLYATLVKRIEETEGDEVGESIWEVLAERVDPAEYRPHFREEAEVRTFKLRWGNDYAMIANPTELLHYRISVDDVPLLSLMDGTRAVREIVVQRLQESGDLELDGVADLVRELRTGNFLTDRFVDLRDLIVRAAHPTSRARQKARQFIKELSVDWSGAHRLVEWFYLHLLRHFFRPIPAVLAGLLALLGLVAFVAVYRSGQFELGGDSAAVQMLVLLGMDYFLTFIHELGHAVVLVHYGRRVKSAGFMLYFGSPAFFVESSDVLMLPRGQRIVQAFAGPYAELIVSGAASLFIWSFPDAGISPFLYTWAVLNYFVIFMNLVPLLELDGYFILADVIQVPDLRPRSLQFIRHDLWRKLRGREHITKQELGLAFYGILGVAFTILSVFTAIFFWKTIFGGLVAQLWNGGPLGRTLLIVVGLFIVSPVLRGMITLIRTLLKKLKGIVDSIRFKFETAWRVEAAHLIDSSPIFGDVPEEVLSDLAGRIVLRRYPPGKPVFRQGDRPRAFYVVRTGALHVVEEDPDTGKERVIRTLGRGDSFGELGLVDGAPRSATVRPIEDVQLFEVDESTFDRLLSDMVHVPEFVPTLQQAAELRALGPFVSLSSREITELLDHGEWINVPPDTAVVEEGAEGDFFYVIGSGQADVVQGDELVRTIGPGSHFGELALLMRIPRTASVIARTPVRAFRLDREAFDGVVAAAFRRGIVAAAPIERTPQH
jgi:CRP-like cAMP-binding protein/Zn-dependent protease